MITSTGAGGNSAIAGSSNTTMNVLFNLRKFLIPEIVYGTGAITLAGRHSLNLGASKPFIVTDPGVRNCGWVDKVEASLHEAKLPYAVFDRISPNPKDHEVTAGAEKYLEESCDIILAIGGGSPMDCAKGIGVIVTNCGTITDYEGVDEIPHPAPPFIFIPTTAGTSADVSQFAIITDTARNVKIAIISKMVIPDIALVDPETTTSMSPELTAATGMDALCHAFEAYVSNASSPLTDMAAASACELIFENLYSAYCHPDNLEFRDNMMMASLMAGLAFSNASLGLVHGMAHCLGGAFDLAHGECNALLLEKVVRYNYSFAADKYNALALHLGAKNTAMTPSQMEDYLPDAIAELREKLNIKMGLEKMGVTLDDIENLAGFAQLDPCVATNPRQPTVQDIADLYTQVY